MTRLRRANRGRGKRTINQGPMTFDEAIDDSEGCRKRHLLLGNGFSIAYDSKLFSYTSLFQKADFTGSKELKDAFKVLKTNDFEEVIGSLEQSSELATLYGSKKSGYKMRRHAKSLKEIFLKTLSETNPMTPNEIHPLRKRRCVRFLSKFLNGPNKGNVYTLNYDLLLYWILVDKFIRDVGDGFGNSDSGHITWLGRRASIEQRAHYLHGALHLFDTGSRSQKACTEKRSAPTRSGTG